MKLQVKIHAQEQAKEVTNRLVNENLENKLWSYLSKLNWNDVEWILDINVEKNKKWLFNAKLQVNIDWKSFRYEREDYKNLDDLINHLFDHFKEELASK